MSAPEVPVRLAALAGDVPRELVGIVTASGLGFAATFHLGPATRMEMLPDFAVFAQAAAQQYLAGCRDGWQQVGDVDLFPIIWNPSGGLVVPDTLSAEETTPSGAPR